MPVLCSTQETGKLPTSAPQNTAPVKKYSLRVDWKDGVVHTYSVTEKTKVKRIYRDKLEKNYERETVYYLSMSSTGMDKGFTKLRCVIDSLTYKFTEGNTVLIYDSYDEKKTNIKGEFPDLTATFACMSHQFEFKIAPTGEVASVSGVGENGDIDWLKDYINDPESPMDTLQKTLWLSCISPENLKMIADIPKGIIAGKMQIKADSIWTRTVGMRLDGVNFVDTLKSEVVSFAKSNFVISSVSKALQPVALQSVRMFGIPGLADVISGKGTGTVRLDMTSGGTVKKAEINYSADIEAKYKLEKFSENIQTTVLCTLIGQYKW
ncbi:MAG: hypothetical protein IPM69_17805 [Ignavibacteria bacterium]|nr:hypothetical protein [Ignavibacteria bacterium]